MNLMPTHEQVSIFDTANQVFSELYPLSRFRREADAATAIAERRRLGALGLLGICVPEAEGGTGLTLVEQAIVCQAMGRTCAPLTLVPTMLASEIATARGDARLASALMRGDEAAGILLPATLDGRSDETDPRWTAYGANGAGCFLSVAPGAASLVSLGIFGLIRSSLSCRSAVIDENRGPKFLLLAQKLCERSAKNRDFLPAWPGRRSAPRRDPPRCRPHRRRPPRQLLRRRRRLRTLLRDRARWRREPQPSNVDRGARLRPARARRR